MTRIVVTLDRDERRALDRLSMSELRDPRLQVRYLIRNELEKRGFLEPDVNEPKTTSLQEGEHVQAA